MNGLLRAQRTAFGLSSATGTPPVIRGAWADRPVKVSGRMRWYTSIRVAPQRLMFSPLSQNENFGDEGLFSLPFSPEEKEN